MSATADADVRESSVSTDVVRLVEQLLDIASHGRWEELASVLSPDFRITEPASLPWGGTHVGVAAYIELMTRIAAACELSFDVGRIEPLASGAVLRMDVRFTSRRSGLSVVMPTIELFSVHAGLLASSEVFFADTAALLALLHEQSA